jgi:integrase
MYAAVLAKHWKPAFDNVPLASLTCDRIKAQLGRLLGTGLSASRVKSVLNESLAYVRDQMGHHSIKVTVDIYGHLVPGANKAAVDRLDAPGRNLYATEPVLTVPA